MSILSDNYVDLDGEVHPIRSLYTPRKRFTVKPSDKASRTNQADAKAADINFIVSRYKKTGEIPVINRAPMFSDMSAVDYKESMDVFTAAQQSFARLPASVRDAYGNDPARLLDALDRTSDPKVLQQLVDVGMLPSSVLSAQDEPSGPSKVSSKGSVPSKPKASPEASNSASGVVSSQE